jgi:multiple sugar transport system substrate-binding protein
MFNLPVENEYPLIARDTCSWITLPAGSIPGRICWILISREYSMGHSRNDIYGLPLEYTNWCLYLNKNAFSAIGLDAEKDYPRTWEDVVSLSRKMVVRDGAVLKKRGFDFRYPYYLNFLVPMVEQLGGALVSADGKTAVVGEDAWISVLSFMQAWGPGGVNLGSPTYKNARSSFAGGAPTSPLGRFSLGAPSSSPSGTRHDVA